MSLTRDSCVVVSDEQVSTTIGDETVILGMRDGVYYGLDAVGARIWALLAAPRRVSEIVRTLADEFEATPEQLEHDTLALLDALSSRQLIREQLGDADADLS